MLLANMHRCFDKKQKNILKLMMHSKKSEGCNAKSTVK